MTYGLPVKTYTSNGKVQFSEWSVTVSFFFSFIPSPVHPSPLLRSTYTPTMSSHRHNGWIRLLFRSGLGVSHSGRSSCFLSFNTEFYWDQFTIYGELNLQKGNRESRVSVIMKECLIQHKSYTSCVTDDTGFYIQGRERGEWINIWVGFCWKSDRRVRWFLGFNVSVKSQFP